MSRIKQFRYRIGGVAVVVGVSVLVAACGGGGSSASTTAASTGSAASAGSTQTSTSSSNAAATATPASTKGVSIGTATGSAGTYLTGANGRALYLWVADSGGMSSCSGACAKAWPPLTTKGKPVAGKGVTASNLGTIKRSDGTTQVTYKNHPLYYFIADKSAGSTQCQGSDAFGAPWWLVSPAGAAITSSGSGSGSGSASAAAAPAPSSSSSDAGGSAEPSARVAGATSARPVGTGAFARGSGLLDRRAAGAGGADRPGCDGGRCRIGRPHRDRRGGRVRSAAGKLAALCPALDAPGYGLYTSIANPAS